VIMAALTWQNQLIGIYDEMRWQCHGLFSFKKGAIMQSFKISVRKWIAVIDLIANNIKGVSSSLKLARYLGVTQTLA